MGLLLFGLSCYAKNSACAKIWGRLSQVQRNQYFIYSETDFVTGDIYYVYRDSVRTMEIQRDFTGFTYFSQGYASHAYLEQAVPVKNENVFLALKRIGSEFHLSAPEDWKKVYLYVVTQSGARKYFHYYEHTTTGLAVGGKWVP